jgi:translation initiation factor RLI1
VENSAASFGEFFLAQSAGKESDVFVFATPSAYIDIFAAANAVFEAIFIPAKEVFEVVHDLAY